MPRPPRVPRPRGDLRYNKPALSLDTLVARLLERGLEIPDRERATRYLRHIGYFRLSPYTIPFQQGRPDRLFRRGAGFDDILDIYVFDRTLRLLKMIRDTSEARPLGPPEPAGRSSEADGSSESDDAGVVYRSALEHYLLTHGEPELPPSWLMVETLTVGQLNNVIDNLRLRADRTAVG